MIVRISKVGLNSIPVSINDLSDGPGDLTGNANKIIAVSPDETKLEYISNTNDAGKYKQFVYAVSSGDFSFIKNGTTGEPVMALLPLE